jgi:hypothetical protein
MLVAEDLELLPSETALMSKPHNWVRKKLSSKSDVIIIAARRTNLE